MQFQIPVKIIETSHVVKLNIDISKTKKKILNDFEKLINSGEVMLRIGDMRNG